MPFVDHRLSAASKAGLATSLLALAVAACSSAVDVPKTPDEGIPAAKADPSIWPSIAPLPLDPAVEARVDAIMAKMTLEQKVGQVIQADSNAVTPEEVKKYRLGSVLSGGNSAPGDEPYAATPAWLEAADAYWEASMDPAGVEMPIPMIWGIDAVHGHANLTGAVVFPHNIGLGAMRDPALIERIAQVTAAELSVSGHDWTFAPTVAVPQNDRWGRTYEGYSEDPAVVASYAGPIVTGLQGKVGTEAFMGDGNVISSAKHFLADGGTIDGVDQGDVEISEETLRDIHNAGYTTAIPAGVQTVMASFNSWNGVKMHGNKSLLTDVLKGQMGFNGFVVGDWNGHGQVAGCTNTDCPVSLIAGVDMYMAPDSWQGLYYSTLKHAKSGAIPMERLDDAVRRILRVKVSSGIFGKPKPSARPLAGDMSVLGSAEHRAVAREAVRKSMVLLKNAGGVLPIAPGQRVLVVGDGADSLSKVAGGWTLSWQGGGYENAEFPNGQTIFSAIDEIVTAAGGTAILDPDAEIAPTEADVVIAVYGENPYAEFQGDRPNLDFVPNDFDPTKLASYGEAGVPVVSVFLSGRPMWTNPEMNLSDAFIAAWLPGSEGGGVADLLFQTDPSFDFAGKLSFSWPKYATQAELNKGDADYDPLFPFGYGLTYADTQDPGTLSEDSGLSGDQGGPSGVYFTQGAPVPPLRLVAFRDGEEASIGALPATVESLEAAGTDYKAQEDALALTFADGETSFRIASATGGASLSRERTAQIDLMFAARSLNGGSETIAVGVDCPRNADCAETVSLEIEGTEWREYRVSLTCFSDAVDMEDIVVPVSIGAPGPAAIGLGHVRLEPDTDGGENCGQ